MSLAVSAHGFVKVCIKICFEYSYNAMDRKSVAEFCFLLIYINFVIFS